MQLCMMKRLLLLLFTLTAWMVGSANCYSVGVAIADVTGPPVEVTFMGYGKMEQKGSGIHLRQFSRAFIIQDGSQRFVFISVDVSMMAHGLRKEVVGRLSKMFGNLYTVQNVLITATHTHSAPGGFMQHMLFDLSTLGFVKQSYDALVDGIVKSVKLAHSRIEPARIFLTEGELLDANINRSPTSYENNPAEERARYKHNVDKTMTQLRFVSTDGNRPIGMISWFAVHPTSMNNTNTLISSDNVGYASILFEQRMNPGELPGKGKFVAAFASSNLGDVSPNIRGPKCQHSGLACDIQTSTCANKKDQCVASGPGVDMFKSTKIIAQRLDGKGWELWQQPGEELSGPIKVVHQYVDMPTENVFYKDTNTGRMATVSDRHPWSDLYTASQQCMQHTASGCLPAMGYSFGAGTTDGPGAFSFTQGTRSPNALWNALRDFLAVPTAEDVACQQPKPILIATGQMDFPFEWQPRIVSTQLAMIGPLALAAVPGEFTTMAGRRLRAKLIETTGIDRAVVLGLVNTYSDYIVTPEEYQVQRYEAASTIYGIHTLTIYLHQYGKLADALMKGTELPPGPEPAEMMNDMISLTAPVLYDTPRWDHEFGQCIQQPPAVVTSGQVVTARFVSANPRNDLLHDRSYITVERRDEASSHWLVVATDANWETKFHWIRTIMMLGNSEALVEWTVPDNVTPGEYRIRHFGHYKYIFGGIFPFRGATSSFRVEANHGRSRNTRYRPRD